MYASHLAFLPLIFLSVRYVYPVDAAIAIKMFVYSMIYHSTANDHHLRGGMDKYQRLDHIGVWTLILWKFLRSLDIDISALFGMYIIVSMPFEIFPDILVDSWVFPVVMLPGAVIIYTMRLLIFEIPFPRLSIILLSGSGVFGAAGMVFFYMTTGYGRVYREYHPWWHICIAIAAFLFELAWLGFHFGNRLFGIDRRWDEWMSRWQSDVLGLYVERVRPWYEKRATVWNERMGQWKNNAMDLYKNHYLLQKRAKG